MWLLEVLPRVGDGLLFSSYRECFVQHIRLNESIKFHQRKHERTSWGKVEKCVCQIFVVAYFVKEFGKIVSLSETSL